MYKIIIIKILNWTIKLCYDLIIMLKLTISGSIATQIFNEICSNSSNSIYGK